MTRNGDTYYMAGGFEMCVNGLWATVCQNQWRDSEATVACRQLGLNYTGSMLKLFYIILHSLYTTQYEMYGKNTYLKSNNQSNSLTKV